MPLTDNNKWQTVIGLEVHAQILSHTKLFSHAPTIFGAAPNTQADYLDAGMPGALPVLNHHCVDQAIKTGLSINGTINAVSYFDRKNYFYPDLPTGYQISQFYVPIVQNGFLNITLADGAEKCIHIERIHMEQDAGKSVHDLSPDESYIDYNRSGVGLMEIVTRPDLSSADEVAAFIKKLRSLLKCIGTCDANMESGSLRVDANISLCKSGGPFGTRVEIKNLNSIRFIKQALEHEIQRQSKVLESGGSVDQETRLFNTKTGQTVIMRTKEDAHDYRYFPEPDLPPVMVSEERLNTIRTSMPELPDQKKERFMRELGLSAYDAQILSDDWDVAHYYEQCLAHMSSPRKREPSLDSRLRENDSQTEFPKLMANWMISELFAVLNKKSLTITESIITAPQLAELVNRILDGTISGKIAKTVFALMWEENKSAGTIIEAHNLKQITDLGIIEAKIALILQEHADKVAQYQAGQEKLFGFFVGTVLKAFDGKANPDIVNAVLKKQLG